MLDIKFEEIALDSSVADLVEFPLDLLRPNYDTVYRFINLIKRYNTNVYDACITSGQNDFAYTYLYPMSEEEVIKNKKIMTQKLFEAPKYINKYTEAYHICKPENKHGFLILL